MMKRETTIHELETLYNAASELKGDERRKFLDTACAGRSALRRQLEQMLSTDTAFLSESLLSQALRSEQVTQIGRWRVKNQIGEGGLGIVYRAETVDDGVTMEAAVKILRPGFDSGMFRGRFQQERQILASLSHPGIARFMDCGADEEGRSCLAMEFVSGELLADVLEKSTLTLRQKVDLFAGVAQAVQYLHSRLVVHGDIKPGNVMVTPERTSKLLDFGTARLLGGDAPSTEITRMMLTPHYASPEQKRGEGPSVASDIYSLGRLLQEMWGAEKPEGDLAAIANRCVAGEVDARYPSVGTLIEDLERWRAGYPVRARRQTLLYSASRFARRQWHVVGLTTLLIASLAIGWMNSLRSADEARRLASEAQRSAEEARQSAAEAGRQTELARFTAIESDRQKSRAEAASTQALDSATRYRRLLEQMLDEDAGSAKPGPAGEATVVLERGFGVLIQQLEKENAALGELATAWRRLGSLQCKRGDYTRGLVSLRKSIHYAGEWRQRSPSAESRTAEVMNRLHLVQQLTLRRNFSAAQAEGSLVLALFENLPGSEKEALMGLPVVQFVLIMASQRAFTEDRAIQILSYVLEKTSRGLNGIRLRTAAVSRLVDIHSKRGTKEKLPQLCKEAEELLIADTTVRRVCFGPNGDLPFRSPLITQLLSELGADDQSYTRKLQVGEISANLSRNFRTAGAPREALSALALARKALEELTAVDPNGPGVVELRRRLDRMERVADWKGKK
ncbi:MAG: serine/threonine protein kinase [Acidobacteria bacterium]|nr:serine/threonine protein kinase [Acidobacteriota bacterium]